MEVVFSTGFEDGKFPPYPGQELLLVPEGWHPDWMPGQKPGPVRPEIQPEDLYRGDKGFHKGRYGLKISHAYSFFDGVVYRQFPAIVGASYQLRAYSTAESGGGLQCRIGIDPTGGEDFRAGSVVWDDGWGTDDPGFKPYEWRQLCTAIVKATGEHVTIFMNVRCRDAVQVNAGFFDDVELLADVDNPTPEPGSVVWMVDLHITGTIELLGD